MSSVYARSAHPPPRAVRARGSLIWDATGREYLDGSGGAIVVGVGHGATEVTEAVTRQLASVGYVHGSMFTTEAVESYTADLAALLPMTDARIYPVSGGSEAVETALKLARSFHLARGEDRSIVIARTGSYHGNSRGALAVSGRPGLREPYSPWLSGTEFIPAPYEYRCPFPAAHPSGCAAEHARRLAETIDRCGADRVAAFIAEPVCGATLGACVPGPDYWSRMAAVCRDRGVLLIADEVMTGFGRTGRWFASEHFGLRPDIMTLGKGAASGYWPLGLVACTGVVHDAQPANRFVHGFTYSHHPAGAAAGHAVLRLLRGLVPAVSAKGERLARALTTELADHPHVGDIRGIGLLRAVELVADRSTRSPFPRHRRVIERITAMASSEGMLIYGSAGCADGTDGDLVLLGPPLVTSEAQLDAMAAKTARAINTVLADR